MRAQDFKNLSVAAPVMFFMWQAPHGFTQIAGTVGAAALIVAASHLAARFVWTPVFKRGGLPSATLFLVCGIVAGLIGTFAVVAMKLGDQNSFIWKLASNCAVFGLLFSWVLAAV